MNSWATYKKTYIMRDNINGNTFPKKNVASLLLISMLFETRARRLALIEHLIILNLWSILIKYIKYLYML